ncbi:hypothetical protein TWF694_003271 [Orbilia ellipsospora]|uniref:Uncharacterized protein n=1 Tax=Orbilia ellipsospora TaxID=2528407 RepID=A0AAV9X143_9PEZI
MASKSPPRSSVDASAKATTRIFDQIQSTSYSEISPATAFAAIGLFWVLISLRVFALWVSSPEFQPAPILPPDKPTAPEKFALNLFHGQNVVLACAMVFLYVVIPLRANPVPRRVRDPSEPRRENIWLNSRLMLGGVFCMFTDSYLNAYDYVFAWNSNAVNFGSWAKFMPFGDPNASSRYGIGVLWVIPVYMYFCCGSMILGGKVFDFIRKMNPRANTLGLLTILCIWGFQFCLDFVIQIATLRYTSAYAFAKTYKPLTLFAGDRYQYPIYNSISVACLTTAFTYLGLIHRMELGARISLVERGYSEWPQTFHSTVRTLAIVGFCVLNTLLCFTIPLTMLGIFGDSIADLPSYMMPG